MSFASPQSVADIGENARGDTRFAGGDLLREISKAKTKSEAWRLAAGAAAVLFPGGGLLLAPRSSDGGWLGAEWLLPLPGAAAWEARLTKLCAAAADAGEPCWDKLKAEASGGGDLAVNSPAVRGATLTALAVPVFYRGAAPEALCLALPRLELAPAQYETTARWLALHVTLWQVMRQADAARLEAAGVAARSELVQQVLAAADCEAALRTLVGALQDAFRCERVALGLRRGGVCRLSHVSGQSEFDRESELARALSAALEDVAEAESPSAWPGADDEASPGALTLRRAASLSSAPNVIGLPLRDGAGASHGAVLLLAGSQSPPLGPWRQELEAWQAPLARAARLWRLARGERLGSAGGGWRRRLRAWRGWLAAAAALLAAAALALPTPHRLGCACVIEPVTRRFIVAPFAGRLERNLVAPGDTVAAGQIVAMLEAKELALDLAALEAERQRADKRREAALAARSAALAQVAALEARQAEAKIELLLRRQEQLAIKSPLAGVIVRGDLARSEGAPVTVGQTLLEVAPLDRMVVEVAIAESEVAHVREGAEVELRLEAFPHRVWRGVLGKIQPRAELREHEQVFLGEVELNNADGALRPGMRGRAKVLGATRSLGWVLLHRPLAELAKYWP